MAGQHTSQSSHSDHSSHSTHSSYHHRRRSTNWRLIILIIVLVVIVAAIAFLLFRLFTDVSGSAQTDPGITTTVTVQDANGKDVTSKISVSEGTRTPDTAQAGDEFTLLNVAWTANSTLNTPVIITVKDSAFTNGDGLAVYQYSNSEWNLLGTYLIAGNSVSFQTDNLSYFAFQVMSSTPTPSPSPTPEPVEEEPEESEEPEEIVIEEVYDYGTYDEVLEGDFVEVDSLTLGSSYVIAIVDDNSGVTYFDAEDDTVSTAGVTTANILINYDDETLHTVEAKIAQDASGYYYIDDEVVEGMLFTAVSTDEVAGYDRFSLESQEKFLNVDDDTNELVLDDNDVRTRWLYGSIALEDEESNTEQIFTTLSYYNFEEQYYPNDFTTVSTETSAEIEGVIATDELSVALSTSDTEAKTLIIFEYIAVSDITMDADGKLIIHLDIGDLSMADVEDSLLIYLDDEFVDTANYTISEGLTITFNSDFITSLDPTQTHTIVISYVDPVTGESVTTTFSDVSVDPASYGLLEEEEENEEEEEEEDENKEEENEEEEQNEGEGTTTSSTSTSSVTPTPVPTIPSVTTAPTATPNNNTDEGVIPGVEEDEDEGGNEEQDEVSEPTPVPATDPPSSSAASGSDADAGDGGGDTSVSVSSDSDA